MNTTVQTLRRAQRAAAIQEWLDAESRTFSVLMEESVSRRQVILANLVFMFIITGALVCQASILLAAAAMTAALLAARRLSGTERKGGSL